MTQDGVDSDVTTLRDAYDWYIEPVFNPDGYDYSWTTVRRPVDMESERK